MSEHEKLVEKRGARTRRADDAPAAQALHAHRARRHRPLRHGAVSGARRRVRRDLRPRGRGGPRHHAHTRRARVRATGATTSSSRRPATSSRSRTSGPSCSPAMPLAHPRPRRPASGRREAPLHRRLPRLGQDHRAPRGRPRHDRGRARARRHRERDRRGRHRRRVRARARPARAGALRRLHLLHAPDRARRDAAGSREPSTTQTGSSSSRPGWPRRGDILGVVRRPLPPAWTPSGC